MAFWWTSGFILCGTIVAYLPIKTAQGTANYISGVIQNQTLSSCSILIVKQIISKVNATKCFTVLADETADISGIEQFSPCARCFDFSSMKMRGFLNVCSC